MRVDGGQRAGETRWHDRRLLVDKPIVLIRGTSAFCLRMTIPLGRFVMAYPQNRISTYSRRVAAASTQPRLIPMQGGGRNLGSRFQQLESSVRSTARKVALLDEMADTSRLVEQHDSLSFTNKSRAPRENVEMFHGLAVPREPKSPESDGESLGLSFTLSLILILEGTCAQNVVCPGVRSAFTISTRTLS